MSRSLALFHTSFKKGIFQVFLSFLLVPKAGDFYRFDFVFFDEAFNGVEDDSELPVVFSFHFFNLFPQLFIAHDYFPDFRERAHNLDIHEDCTLAFQDGRKHGDALFGENIGQFSFPAPT
jgi:hypothetical protein